MTNKYLEKVAEDNKAKKIPEAAVAGAAGATALAFKGAGASAQKVGDRAASLKAQKYLNKPILNPKTGRMHTLPKGGKRNLTTHQKKTVSRQGSKVTANKFLRNIRRPAVIGAAAGAGIGAVQFATTKGNKDA